jgi:hypothetical protein
LLELLIAFILISIQKSKGKFEIKIIFFWRHVMKIFIKKYLNPEKETSPLSIWKSFFLVEG